MDWTLFSSSPLLEWYSSLHLDTGEWVYYLTLVDKPGSTSDAPAPLMVHPTDQEMLSILDPLCRWTHQHHRTRLLLLDPSVIPSGTSRSGVPSLIPLTHAHTKLIYADCWVFDGFVQGQLGLCQSVELEPAPLVISEFKAGGEGVMVYAFMQDASPSALASCSDNDEECQGPSAPVL